MKYSVFLPPSLMAILSQTYTLYYITDCLQEKFGIFTAIVTSAIVCTKISFPSCIILVLQHHITVSIATYPVYRIAQNSGGEKLWRI